MLRKTVLRILVPKRLADEFRSSNTNANEIMDRFQRIAVRAAGAGIAASILLGLVKILMDRVAPGSAQLRSSFEAVCAMLWPKRHAAAGSADVSRASSPVCDVGVPERGIFCFWRDAHRGVAGQSRLARPRSCSRTRFDPEVFKSTGYCKASPLHTLAGLTFA